MQRDPIHHPCESSYSAFGSNPILFTDPLGLASSLHKMENGELEAASSTSQIEVEGKKWTKEDEDKFLNAHPEYIYPSDHFNAIGDGIMKSLVKVYTFGVIDLTVKGEPKNPIEKTEKSVEDAITGGFKAVELGMTAGGIVDHVGGTGEVSRPTGEISRPIETPKELPGSGGKNIKSVQSETTIKLPTASTGVTAVVNGVEYPVIRGAYTGKNCLDIVPGEYKINSENGLVKTTHGLSLDVDPNNLGRFDELFYVQSVPTGLKVIQRGNRIEHFEIVPEYEMKLSEYQKLLHQVKLTNYKK